MPDVAAPVVVAMDATPLLGVRTGVGESVAGFINAAGHRLISMSSGSPSAQPKGEPFRQLPPGSDRVGGSRSLPALLLRTWARLDHPAVEWWTGPVEVVHGTNFVVPPSRKAARLVTVHDLTPVRFPELCSPSSLRYPGLIRRAVDRAPPFTRCHRPWQRRHGSLPCRGRSGPCHPQRAHATGTPAADGTGGVPVHSRHRDRGTAQGTPRSRGGLRPHRRGDSRRPSEDRRTPGMG